nr:MAG TPA_asm: hypothetical protein [Caudoviricetes sp.]
MSKELNFIPSHIVHLYNDTLTEYCDNDLPSSDNRLSSCYDRDIPGFGLIVEVFAVLLIPIPEVHNDISIKHLSQRRLICPCFFAFKVIVAPKELMRKPINVSGRGTTVRRVEYHISYPMINTAFFHANRLKNAGPVTVQPNCNQRFTFVVHKLNVCLCRRHRTQTIIHSSHNSTSPQCYLCSWISPR